MDLERRLLEKKDELATIKSSTIFLDEDAAVLSDKAKPGFFEGWPDEGEYRFMQFYLPAYKRTFLVFGRSTFSHADIAEYFFKFCDFEYYVSEVDMNERGSRYKLNIAHPKKKDASLVGAGFCDISKEEAIVRDKSTSYNVEPDKKHISQIISREDVPYRVSFK